MLAIAALLSNSLFSGQLGNITRFSEKNNYFEIETSDGATTRIIYYKTDIFRIWVAPDGKFTDPAGDEETPIVVYNGEPLQITQSDQYDYYKLETSLYILRIYKTPCSFALYKKDNVSLLFEESEPIKYGKQTIQSIKRNKKDYFYGCGMQNGHFCHNDRIIQIENNYDDKQDIWNEHGTPNATSFYMSLNGYGVFRNSYEGGTYEFLSNIKTTHKE
ncbi:uncharacterized protein METZ01_LOCUS170064, partial [marine metagenome]